MNSVKRILDPVFWVKHSTWAIYCTVQCTTTCIKSLKVLRYSMAKFDIRWSGIFTLNSNFGLGQSLYTVYIWTQIKCLRKWTTHLHWITVHKFVSDRLSIFLYADLFRFHPPWWTQGLWERTPADGSCYCPPPVSPGGSDSTPGTVSTCRSIHLWLVGTVSGRIEPMVELIHCMLSPDGLHHRIIDDRVEKYGSVFVSISK